MSFYMYNASPPVVCVRRFKKNEKTGRGAYLTPIFGGVRLGCMTLKTVKRLCLRSAGLCLGLGLILSWSGCTANPVTGKKEFRVMSEKQELDIGQKMYIPLQQEQGGAYVVDKELTAYVVGVADRLADVSDRHLPYEFVVLNNSAVNAWALPGGKIAINRGLLLELDNEAQLAAVIGHEIVHSAARHSARQYEKGILLNLALVGAQIAAHEHRDGRYAVMGASVGAHMISLKYGRDNELESDKYGMVYMSRAGYDPAEAIRVQEMFVRLSGGKTPGRFATLFRSHPPSQHRVDKNAETAGTLRQGGTVNREIYQRMIAGLKKTKPAYDAHDKGRAALSKKQYRSALGLAEEAITLEPREAQFFELKGKAFQGLGNNGEATRAFDKAIALNPKLYDSRLQRGSLRKASGDEAGAREDLDASLRLMATAQGHYQLGLMESDSGNAESALKHFQFASQGQDGFGKSARIEVARRTLAQNPERFIQTSAGVNNRGYAVVQVKNVSPIPIRNLRGQMAPVNAQGERLAKPVAWSVQGDLQPGEIRTIHTRMGPIRPSSGVTGFDVRISHAAAG